ncbi:MAG: FlgD immunoglobulin-like domain containing protein [Candidatus Eisenbacteria bacterium]
MRRTSRSLLSVLLCVLVLAHAAIALAGPKALFDNTKAETAGNADWVIDDNQPVPSPAQGGITWATNENFWTGAASAWGVQLVKRGYTVATLTTAYGITYGNLGNAYDLSKYDVFIVPEPNIRFTAAESLAIFQFVADGGGLIAVSDHSGSDRNNDGYDSPQIFNLLDSQHLWGVHFAVSPEANNNIVQTSTNVNIAQADSIIHGPAGNAAALAYHNGSTMTLYPGINPSVRGNVWMTGLPQTSLTGLMAAQAVYGNGRIFFAGDSSPVDDGTGQPGNTLYTGWAESADSLIFLNATLWATRRAPAGDTTPPTVTVLSPNGGETWDTGSSQAITWSASDDVGVTAVDLDLSLHGANGPWMPIAHALANSGSYGWIAPDSASDSALVRVTAYDAATHATMDASDSVFVLFDPLVAALPGPAGLALDAPFPSPGRGAVTLRYSLPRAGVARLEIVDLAGHVVWRDQGERAAGVHAARWNGTRATGSRAPAGLYFVRLVTPWGSREGRLVLL